MTITAPRPSAATTGDVAPATLCAAFRRSAAAHPQRPALRLAGDEQTLSWAGYADRVRRSAAALAALGIGRGDTVALLLTNRPEAAWVDVAAMHVGATTVSIYVASSARDLEHMLADSGARLVVTERALAGRIEALRHACPALDHVVGVDGAGHGMAALAAVEAAADPGFDLEAHARAVTPDDVVSLLYTSGTTGPPKGVRHTHATILALLRAFEAASPAQPAVSYVSYLPLAHLGERGIGHYRALVRGSTTTFCPDLARLGSALADVHPSWLFGPPRIWRVLQAAVEATIAADPGARAALARSLARVRAQGRGEAAAPLAPRDDTALAGVRTRFGLDRLEHALTAAAPCASEVHEFFLALGLPFAEFYGMTEIGAATMTRPEPADIGTVGRTTPSFELRLAEDAEVLVRGPAVTPGYHGRPHETAALIDAQGWVHTGDVGTLDAEGRLRIVDRLKELIVSDEGHNMSPATIETRLAAASPLIAHACVIGDARPYNVALPVLDPVAAARCAGMAGADAAALAGTPAVCDAVAAAVREANDALDPRERVRRHTVLTGPWAPGGDELTPTSKLRRRAVAARYAAEIDAMYGAQGASARAIARP